MTNPCSFLHKMSLMFDWTTALALITPNADLFVNPLFSASTINLDDLNTKFVMIGIGLVIVFTKWGDAYISFRKRYSETDHGQLMKCLSDREEEREAAKDALYAEQMSHKNDLDRTKAHYDLMVMEFNQRIDNKQKQEDYLKGLVEQGRLVESELRAANVGLTATIVQQTEQLSRLAAKTAEAAQSAAEATRKSIENTGAALKKTKTKEQPPSPETAVSVISAPSAERVDVTVNTNDEAKNA